jgi:endonuclease-8
MPEGPSIIILKEKLQPFSGKKVIAASGDANVDFDRISNQKITAFKSWGKHTLICFNDFYLRIHLLMFGAYRINEKKEGKPRLHLGFKDGEINFYTCNVKFFEGDPNNDYDWEADIMSDAWKPLKAEKKLKAIDNYLVCDALLNQDIFSGSGNIIKNEVLFRTRIHPESLIAALPSKKLKELIKETHHYSFDFLKWKKAFELEKHWLIYTKKECPRCHIPSKIKYLGKGKRITYYCDNCQELYK